MEDIPIFYTHVKATDSTDYLTDAHYHGVHYIRSLMWSRVTTKYKICGILKIEKAIDAMELQQRCDGVKVDAVDVMRLIKTECRLWNRTIFFTFLSFFLNFFSWYFIYFSFRILT